MGEAVFGRKLLNWDFFLTKEMGNEIYCCFSDRPMLLACTWNLCDAEFARMKTQAGTIQQQKK